MRYILRFSLFITIVWSLVAGLWWVFVPLMLVYLFKYDGIELVLAAILTDGYYQYFYTVPIFTISTTCLYLFFSFIKPRLLMYTD